MRRFIHKAGRVLGVSSLGYAGYITCVQFAVHKEIRERDKIQDVRQKYAPIKILGRYINPFDEYRHQTLFEFAFRRVSELFGSKNAGNVPSSKEALLKSLPQLRPDFHKAPVNKIVLTWIGQSCAVVQLPGNVTILTDPVFCDYVVSPKIGPQRLITAPCTVRDIPKPQVVLVSHDHQDHLDLTAVKSLVKAGTTFVVPQGVQKHFPKSANIIEMNWWDKIPLPNTDPKMKYEVACTPAMHWSGRKLYDSNLTLWCSFMILRNGKPIFFHGGDTGYSKPMFQAIQKVYGSDVSVAMLPCGAYHPQWHLKAQHMSPRDCINASQDLKAQSLIGVHWGTFVMSEEPYYEPPKLLALESKAYKHHSDYARTIHHGQTVELDVL